MVRVPTIPCRVGDSAIIAQRGYSEKQGDTRMNDRIESIRHADGVVELHLARADKMNALDPAMFDALIDAGTRLRDDAGVRAVVLAGRGKAFCAGLDMQSFERMEGGGSGVIGAGSTGRDL